MTFIDGNEKKDKPTYKIHDHERKFDRLERLLGSRALQTLKNTHVAVFGLGGVGGHVLEGLVRSGIGNIDLFDHDVITISNFNRQILATDDTLGLKKVLAAKKRAKSISQNIQIQTYDMFYSDEQSNNINFKKYDYVIDAIDTISSKIALIKTCAHNNTPIISAMGAGNKMNPLDFKVVDIYNTNTCPLAKVMRRELRKADIKKLKVVCSTEETFIKIEKVKGDEKASSKPHINKSNQKIIGSNAFVPGTMGLIIAGEVIKDLISEV